MDLDWFSANGQTESDGIATGASLGQVESEYDCTTEEATTVPRYNDKPCDGDEEMSRVIEASPLMGFIESAEHAIAGDEKRARRAAAKATKSAIIAKSAIEGNRIGGPAGAAIAAAGKTIGEYAEMGINNTIHQDNTPVEGSFQKLHGVEFVKRMAMDAALQGMTAACAAYREPADYAFQDTFLDHRGKEDPRETYRYAVRKGDDSRFRQRRGPNRFRNSRKTQSFTM